MSDFETRWRELISGKNREWWSGAARGGLSVLAALYGGVVRIYRAGFDLRLLHTQRMPCPVIGIGNITVGGTGKTTTVRWLVRRLQEWGMRPAILSYGYRAGEGGAPDGDGVVVAGPEGVRVPTSGSGDEPQLLARSLPGVPLIAGRRRVRTGRRACAEFHPDVLVLDDSFQYWRLEKDLELVLINATQPFGYGRMLPRGMLREPLSGLRRAQGAVITHADRVSSAERESIRKTLHQWNPGLVIAEARHVPTLLRDMASGNALALDAAGEGEWLAMSALGQPESFERTLADLGIQAVPLRFPDHHGYTEEDLRRARSEVERHGLRGILTTEKDSVKIQPEWLGETCGWVLEVDLEFLSGQAEIEALLRQRLGRPAHD